MMNVLPWCRENAAGLVLALYLLMTAIGYSVRRLPEKQQAALTAVHPRFVAFAFWCSGWAGHVLTIAESFGPMLTGKPMPRFKRLVEDEIPTDKTLPPSPDSKPNG